MVLEIEGIVAVKGMPVATNRGEIGILTGWREPHKPSSSGRVHVQLEGNSYQSEFFPGVIGGKFVKEDIGTVRNTYIRLSAGKKSKVLGPFESVSIKENELRVLPEDGTCIFCAGGLWYIEPDDYSVDYEEITIYSK